MLVRTYSWKMDPRNGGNPRLALLGRSVTTFASRCRSLNAAMRSCGRVPARLPSRHGGIGSVRHRQICRPTQSAVGHSATLRPYEHVGALHQLPSDLCSSVCGQERGGSPRAKHRHLNPCDQGLGSEQSRPARQHSEELVDQYDPHSTHGIRWTHPVRRWRAGHDTSIGYDPGNHLESLTHLSASTACAARPGTSTVTRRARRQMEPAYTLV
jgi:hypothetical protein